MSTRGDVTEDSNATIWEGKPYKNVIFKILYTCLLGITIVGWLFVPFVWISKTKYAITRTRLIIEYGYFLKSSTEVRICDIRNIRLVDKSLLYGTATLAFDVSGSDGAEIVFRNILAPEQVRDLVRQMQG